MKIINFEDIKRLGISPSLCYQWVEDVIKAKQEAILPLKINMKPFEGSFCNVMPCVLQNGKDFRGGESKLLQDTPKVLQA